MQMSLAHCVRKVGGMHPSPLPVWQVLHLLRHLPSPGFSFIDGKTLELTLQNILPATEPSLG